VNLWAIVDGDGIVIRAGAVPAGHALPDGAVDVPLGVGLGQVSRYFRIGDHWALRPALPAPVETAEGWAVDDLPEGAAVWVLDADGGEAVPAAGLSGALPDDGDFQITVSGPAPWRPSSVQIRRGLGSVMARAVARAAQVARVKAEASRRILEVVPEWKQRNLTAQAAQLAEKGRANWTAEDLAAWNAGMAIWAQVAAVRAASDAIEAMAEIPADVADPALWP
jgi:hypothetical protein